MLFGAPMTDKRRERQKAKFYKGQIVMRIDGPIKITNLSYYPTRGWLYGGQGKEAWESNLRELTDLEADLEANRCPKKPSNSK